MFAKLFDLVDKLMGKAPAPLPPPRRTATAGAKPSAAKAATGAVVIPRVCADPARYAHEKGAAVWQFQVPDQTHACAAAIALNGHRVGAESASATPLPQCDRNDCRCNYRLLPEQRKGPRRSGEERREQVRFDIKKVDRRKNDGRRKEDGWTGAKP